MHTRLGMPLYDVDQLILHPNKENANVPHGPEATNLTLPRESRRNMLSVSVFSQEIADAHMRGISISTIWFYRSAYVAVNPSNTSNALA